MTDIILDIAHDAVGVLSLPSNQHYVECQKSRVAFIGDDKGIANKFRYLGTPEAR
jgi:hypothetical protein